MTLSAVILLVILTYNLVLGLFRRCARQLLVLLVTALSIFLAIVFARVSENSAASALTQYIIAGTGFAEFVNAQIPEKITSFLYVTLQMNTYSTFRMIAIYIALSAVMGLLLKLVFKILDSRPVSKKSNHFSSIVVGGIFGLINGLLVAVLLCCPLSEMMNEMV